MITIDYILKSIFAASLFLIALIFQSSSGFAVFGVTPNLIIIAILGIAFVDSYNVKTALSGFVLFLILEILIFSSFWSAELVIAGIASFLSYFFIKAISTTKILDFILGTILAIAMFYLIIWGMFLSLPWIWVAGELVYSAVICLPIAYFFGIVKKYE